MNIQDLVAPARVSITITAIICAISFYKAFKGSQPASLAGSRFMGMLTVWMIVMGSVALVFTHTSIFGLGGVYLPFGVVPGFILAFLSLFWKPAIDAFDGLSDQQLRSLMTYRIVFGAFLFAGAGLTLFPPVFAMTAGIGDLAAGWLAAVAGGSLIDDKNIKWRWLVHGWGTIDLLDVAILGTFVVRPWLIENQSLGPSLLLPWVAVPLLLAINLHGLRQTFRRSRSTNSN